MNRVIIFFLVLSCSIDMAAQFSIATDNKSLQFSGYIVSFYNQRFYDANTTDHSKNRFNLDFAVFQMQGVTANRVRYELQLNFPAIYAVDATDEFLMQATTEYRNKKNNFGIQVGYDKLPFSWASMMPQNESAFMQRAEVVRGKTFNRRDLGVTITQGFLNKRLLLIAGVYTGQGMQSIIGDNDPNGKFLYAGRLEASFPARYRNEEVDMNHTPIPRVCIGADGSYSEKTLTTGTDYPILTVNGTKTSYSGDVTASWRGFSMHLERITFRIQPNDTTVLLGKPTDYYLAQGVIAQCNYYSKKLKSIFALRYDEFNPNDLALGDNRETVSAAYNYLINGMNSSIKVHYFHRLKAENAAAPWSDDQLRIGWQVKF
jgi:Phosphate-selective porin O and P